MLLYIYPIVPHAPAFIHSFLLLVTVVKGTGLKRHYISTPWWCNFPSVIIFIIIIIIFCFINRLIADTRVSKIVTSCANILNIENETEEKQREYQESLCFTAPPEWACWQTGVELSCFDVKLMRVCQLDEAELFSGHDGTCRLFSYFTSCFAYICAMID